MKHSGDFSIDSRLINHLLNSACKRGLNLEFALQKAGIDHSSLHGMTTRLDVKKTCKLFNYSRLMIQDEYHGLLQKTVPPGSFRLMALSVVHQHTLGEALKRILEFFNVSRNSFIYTLYQDHSQAFIEMSPIADQQQPHYSAVDYQLCFILRFLGWLINENVIPNHVDLKFSPPDYHDEYQSIYFGAPISFHQPHIRLCFNTDYLKKPIVQNEASVEDYVQRAPLDLFIPNNLTGEITLAVKSWIQQCIVEERQPPKLELLADVLGYHPQKLRRQLDHEGSSYQELKLQVRRDLAIRYLNHNDISVESVAEKVGYTEASSFVRAFKNWTGLTPQQFRNEPGNMN